MSLAARHIRSWSRNRRITTLAGRDRLRKRARLSLLEFDREGRSLSNVTYDRDRANGLIDDFVGNR